MVTSSFWLWAAQRSFYLKHVRVSTVRRATVRTVQHQGQWRGVGFGGGVWMSGLSGCLGWVAVAAALGLVESAEWALELMLVVEWTLGVTDCD
jgi:hypothetical protein